MPRRTGVGRNWISCDLGLQELGDAGLPSEPTLIEPFDFLWCEHVVGGVSPTPETFCRLVRRTIGRRYDDDQAAVIGIRFVTELAASHMERRTQRASGYLVHPLLQSAQRDRNDRRCSVLGFVDANDQRAAVV